MQCVGCRTGGIQDKKDAELEGCRTGGTQDWRNVGLKGCRKVRMKRTGKSQD